MVRERTGECQRRRGIDIGGGRGELEEGGDSADELNIMLIVN